ncbi:MAG: hypothetical protein ABSG03_36735 [Bryobacteraceae bacterium]|jgi:hypothetical protein
MQRLVNPIYDPSHAKPLGWGSLPVVFDDRGARMAVGSEEISYLFRTSGHVGDEWRLSGYLTPAHSIAFGPADEVFTGDDDGGLTISKISDARLLRDLPRDGADQEALQPFENRWAPIPPEGIQPPIDRSLGPLKEFEDLGKMILTSRPSNSSGWALRSIGPNAEIFDSGAQVVVLTLALEGATEAAFGADGKAVALRSSGHVRVWSLDPKYYIASICVRLRAYARLTPINWDPDLYRNVCGSIRVSAMGTQ